MKINSLTLRLAALALAPLFTQGAFADGGPAPVSVKVDGLAPHVAAAVQNKAGQGITELRRYVERTRMIHALYLPDLVRSDDGAENVAASPALQKASQKSVMARNAATPAPKSRVAVAAARQKSAVTVAKASRPATTQPVKALARVGSPYSRA